MRSFEKYLEQKKWQFQPPTPYVTTCHTLLCTPSLLLNFACEDTPSLTKIAINTKGSVDNAAIKTKQYFYEKSWVSDRISTLKQPV